MGSDSYDIAIIGAGPAGSTFARLLDKQYRVLLVDGRNLHEREPRHAKACGALIAPDAQGALAQLGLGLPKEVLVGPQLFGVQTLDLQSGRTGVYLRHYINTDRERFDRWLYSLVGEGVEKRPLTRLVHCTRVSDGFQLQLKEEGGRMSEVKARILVGADGARSKVRSCLSVPWVSKPREYMAIQEWYEADSPQAHFGVFFDPELTDFYGWTIPKDNALILGLALKPGPRALEGFLALKAKLAQHGTTFGACIKREAHPILRPRFQTRLDIQDEQLLLIGEAGAFISPSSAEGFSYAFKSAALAAQVLNESLDRATARFESHAKGLRRSLALKSLKAPFLYQPTLRNLITASGIQQLSKIGS